MEQTINEFAYQLNLMSKYYDQMMRQYNEFRPAYEEIFLVSGNGSENLAAKEIFSQLDSTIEIIGKSIAGFKDQATNLSNEFGKIQKPLDELSRKINLLQAKKTLNSNFLSFIQTKELIDLINFPVGTKWTLLYSGQRDGFGARDFHDHCDGYSPTLTIVKSTSGRIFGGYTKLDWGSCQRVECKDPSSFLFSLVNENNCPYVAHLNDWDSPIIRSSPTSGPVFGNHELSIGDGCNLDGADNKSRNFYFYKTPETISTPKLAEENQFKVAEIEVFY